MVAVVFLSFRSCIHYRPIRDAPFARQTVSGHGSNAFPELAPGGKHVLGWVIRILESSSQSWLVSKTIYMIQLHARWIWEGKQWDGLSFAPP